jgi:hypothetical protein
MSASSWFYCTEICHDAWLHECKKNELLHVLLHWLFHVYCHHLVICSVTLLQKNFSSLKTTVFPQQLSTWVDMFCFRYKYHCNHKETKLFK